jgi:hypothetical protein
MSQQIPNNHSVMSVWKQMIIRLVITVLHLNTMADRWKRRVCSLRSFALLRITSESLLMVGKRMLGWQQNCCLPFVIWLTCWQFKALIMLYGCIITRQSEYSNQSIVFPAPSSIRPTLACTSSSSYCHIYSFILRNSSEDMNNYYERLFLFTRWVLMHIYMMYRVSTTACQILQGK